MTLVDVEPGDLNVVRDVILQVSQPLLVVLGLQLRHGTSGGRQSAVKDRDVDIQAGSGVMAPQVRDSLAIGRRFRRHQRAYSGKPEISLGPSELLR